MIQKNALKILLTGIPRITTNSHEAPDFVTVVFDCDWLKMLSSQSQETTTVRKIGASQELPHVLFLDLRTNRNQTPAKYQKPYPIQSLLSAERLLKLVAFNVKFVWQDNFEIFAKFFEKSRIDHNLLKIAWIHNRHKIWTNFSLEKREQTCIHSKHLGTSTSSGWTSVKCMANALRSMNIPHQIHCRPSGASPTKSTTAKS